MFWVLSCAYLRSLHCAVTRVYCVSRANGQWTSLNITQRQAQRDVRRSEVTNIKYKYKVRYLDMTQAGTPEQRPQNTLWADKGKKELQMLIKWIAPHWCKIIFIPINLKVHEHILHYELLIISMWIKCTLFCTDIRCRWSRPSALHTTSHTRTTIPCKRFHYTDTDMHLQ